MTRIAFINQTASHVMDLVLDVHAQLGRLSNTELADMRHAALERASHENATERIAGNIVAESCRAILETRGGV